MFKEELIPNYKYNTELYHHGIFGQKWGKRQGPPYPLNADEHSSSERKAGYRKSIDNPQKDPRSYKAKMEAEEDNKIRKKNNDRTDHKKNIEKKREDIFKKERPKSNNKKKKKDKVSLRDLKDVDDKVMKELKGKMSKENYKKVESAKNVYDKYQKIKKGVKIATLTASAAGIIFYATNRTKAEKIVNKVLTGSDYSHEDAKRAAFAALEKQGFPDMGLGPIKRIH